MFSSKKFHVDIFKNFVRPQCAWDYFPVEMFLLTICMEMYVSVFFCF